MLCTKTSPIPKDRELLTWIWVGASLPDGRGMIRGAGGRFLVGFAALGPL